MTGREKEWQNVAKKHIHQKNKREEMPYRTLKK